jgi:hypothetical protein
MKDFLLSPASREKFHLEIVKLQLAIYSNRQSTLHTPICTQTVILVSYCMMDLAVGRFAASSAGMEAVILRGAGYGTTHAGGRTLLDVT